VVAGALIHHSLTGVPGPIGVRVKGGDMLEVGFRRDGETFHDVTLTGPADFVFEGQVKI
jgi:diaminopimelate epimerase